MLFIWLSCLSTIVRAVSNVRRTCEGSNDDAFDNDPEDPDYVEELVKEFEGKSYRPSLIMLNPDFHKHKIWPTFNKLMHDVSFRMFFSSLGVTQVCLSHSLIFEHPDSLDNPRSKVIISNA